MKKGNGKAVAAYHCRADEKDYSTVSYRNEFMRDRDCIKGCSSVFVQYKKFKDTCIIMASIFSDKQF